MDADCSTRVAACCLGRSIAGRSQGRIAGDVERLAADHPDLADELRELWGVAALAEEFGSGPRIADAEPANERADHLPQATHGDRFEQAFGDYELLRRAGPRRNGRRLSRTAKEPRSHRRAEDRPRRLGGDARRPGPLSRRSGNGRAAQPPEHRAGL